MRTTTKKLTAVAVGTLIVASACSSSKKSSSTPTTTAGAAATTAAPAASSTSVANKGTYTIGLLTDVTGLAASGNKMSVQGVQGGTVLAARDGYTLKYVVGDTTSSPAGALAAAQKLVEQDHVSGTDRPHRGRQVRGQAVR